MRGSGRRRNKETDEGKTLARRTSKHNHTFESTPVSTAQEVPGWVEIDP